jgi:hypothetical protein
MSVAKSLSIWLINDGSGERHPSYPAVAYAPYHQDLTSKESLHFVQQQLQKCILEHPSCQTASDGEAYMPTRVLDIGTGDDASLDVSLRAPVKLVETARIVSGRLYVCLSHRWGSPGENIVTEKATYEDRKGGMAFCDLGTVYQDTVHILRRMGIRYVWIDSLCIMQDVAEDWLLESKAMAKIYSHAHFTLSRQCDATKSLTEHNSPYLVTESSVLPAVYARAKIPHIWAWDEDQYFPLLSRGWIYQERLLSRRVVHFSDHEIIWECNELSACQCNRATRYSTQRSSPKMDQTVALGSVDLAEKSDVAALRQRWRETVEEYSSLQLTMPTDRLHALQGCAEQMKAKLQDLYTFGHWAGGEARDLLWKRHWRTKPAKRITGGICIPSWSWGSISTGVEFSDGLEPEIQVTYDEPKHDPCHGQTSSYMLVEGKVLSGWLKLGRNRRRKHKPQTPLQGSDGAKDKQKGLEAYKEDPERRELEENGPEEDLEEVVDRRVEVGTYSQHLANGTSSTVLTWSRNKFYEDYDLQTAAWDSEARYDVELLLCGQDKHDRLLLVLWRYGKSIPGTGLRRQTIDGHTIYQRIGVISEDKTGNDGPDIDWTKAGGPRTVAIE